MTGPVHPTAMGKVGIQCRIPREEERGRIDEIMFNELVYGEMNESARLFFKSVIDRMKDEGCDGEVLGCTEIPLLIDPTDCPLPTLDSTRLLARAALEESLR